MVWQFKKFRILRDFNGRAPAHRIAEDIIMLPAGTEPM